MHGFAGGVKIGIATSRMYRSSTLQHSAPRHCYHHLKHFIFGRVTILFDVQDTHACIHPHISSLGDDRSAALPRYDVTLFHFFPSAVPQKFAGRRSLYVRGMLLNVHGLLWLRLWPRYPHERSIGAAAAAAIMCLQTQLRACKLTRTFFLPACAVLRHVDRTPKKQNGLASCSGLDPSGFDLDEESWVWSLARPPPNAAAASSSSSSSSITRTRTSNVRPKTATRTVTAAAAAAASSVRARSRRPSRPPPVALSISTPWLWLSTPPAGSSGDGGFEADLDGASPATPAAAGASASRVRSLSSKLSAFFGVGRSGPDTAAWQEDCFVVAELEVSDSKRGSRVRDGVRLPRAERRASLDNGHFVPLDSGAAPQAFCVVCYTCVPGCCCISLP